MAKRPTRKKKAAARSPATASDRGSRRGNAQPPEPATDATSAGSATPARSTHTKTDPETPTGRASRSPSTRSAAPSAAPEDTARSEAKKPKSAARDVRATGNAPAARKGGGDAGKAEPKAAAPSPATSGGTGDLETGPAAVSPPDTAARPEPGSAPAPALPARAEAPIPVPDEAAGPAPAEAESVHVDEPVPDEGPLSQDEHAPHAEQGPSLFIVHITPEMAPVAKVGGLADVVFGLSRELAIRGNHVEIVLPKYDNLRYDHIFELNPVYNDLWVPWYNGAIHCTVYFGFVHDRKCFFIEPHSQDNFFNRGSIYGFSDDVMRYAFFSRAAMEFLFKAGKHPDVIHCHDWQTALVPVLLYEVYQHLGMTHPRVCLTIHNFKHQGVTGMEVLRATGLHQPERFFDFNRLRDNNNAHALNLLKGGIVYSNFITTVSPRYAFETKDGGQGFGLEATLHVHHMKYGGVVNGIDYDVWNPEVDGHIPVRYGIDSIDGKYDNKRALRHRLMLADNEKPIVAFIGRLDPQKGLELVRHAIFHSLERGAQFVLLGSSPDHGINADFWGLKQMLNDSPDCHLEIGFDEDLSHLIYAGADMMLVPSRFEPCGLTQLIALRYGTIPVVRAVGGLADTVFDKDHASQPLHERNGYVFDHYDMAGLESALGRAIACYYNHPDHFRELIKNAMRSDYSWNHPGRDYLNIYDHIRHK